MSWLRAEAQFGIFLLDRFSFTAAHVDAGTHAPAWREGLPFCHVAFHQGAFP